jgi:hypothetical protein
MLLETWKGVWLTGVKAPTTLGDRATVVSGVTVVAGPCVDSGWDVGVDTGAGLRSSRLETVGDGDMVSGGAMAA